MQQTKTRWHLIRLVQGITSEIHVEYVWHGPVDVNSSDDCDRVWRTVTALLEDLYPRWVVYEWELEVTQ